MRESDENDDRGAESTAAVTAADVGLARTDRDADRMDEAAIEDVFESGAMAPSVVEASVDALFERFEEDSPEEVMLADRFPAESDVVPAPPAFDEFAADVTGDVDVAGPADQPGDADLPVDADLSGVVDAAGDGEFDGTHGGVRGDESVPEPGDVVGFEDAPEPTASDESGTVDAESVDVNADAASFEWVSEPVVTETVLADPEAARAFAGGESGEEEESAGVLSELRSSFPF